MSGSDGEKISELVKGIYSLYERLGKPDTISFLDRGIRLSWRLKTAGLAGYEKIPVDPEFLHNLSGASWNRGEIDVYIHGYEFVVESSWSEVRAGINDVASFGEGFRGCD